MDILFYMSEHIELPAKLLDYFLRSNETTSINNNPQKWCVVRICVHSHNMEFCINIHLPTEKVCGPHMCASSQPEFVEGFFLNVYTNVNVMTTHSLIVVHLYRQAAVKSGLGGLGWTTVWREAIRKTHLLNSKMYF